MAETAKSAVLRLLAQEGYSGSYGTLLVLALQVGADPDGLTPESDAELFEWRGHLRGLRAALTCVAMYEAKLGPAEAVVVVQRHLEAGAELFGGPDVSRR